MANSTMNSQNAACNEQSECLLQLNNTSLACGYPAEEFRDLPNINDPFIEDEELYDCLFNFDSIHEYSNLPMKEFNILDSHQLHNDNPSNSKNESHSLSISKSSEKKKAQLSRGQVSKSPTRSLKRKVDLTHRADQFKKLYYQIFTSKKKFPKELVKQIHDIILIPCFLKKMSREEYRRIDLYFQEYSKFSERILIYLQKHKGELLESIPELSELK